MSHIGTKVAKARRTPKAPPEQQPGWTTIKVREHVSALVSEVQAIFREDHAITAPPSDVLTNALKAYKEKLRPSATQ